MGVDRKAQPLVHVAFEGMIEHPSALSGRHLCSGAGSQQWRWVVAALAAERTQHALVESTEGMRWGKKTGRRVEETFRTVQAEWGDGEAWLVIIGIATLCSSGASSIGKLKCASGAPTLTKTACCSR